MKELGELTEIEKVALEKNLKEFLHLHEEAITSVKRYIEKFRGASGYDERTLTQGLEKGLKVLNVEYESYKKKGIVRLARMLETQKNDQLIQYKALIHVLCTYGQDRVEGLVDSIRKIQRYFNDMLVARISEAERIELEKKLYGLLETQEYAMGVIKKHIEQLQCKEGNEAVVKDLLHGLSIVEGGYNRCKEEGIGGLAMFLKKSPRGKRPGLSLTRGFGEFLWHGYDWEREIMEALDKIEDYFASM